MSLKETKITIENEAEMLSFAKSVASALSGEEILCLHGTLGAGKTTFARALIRELCGEDTVVPSPTFTLLQTYKTKAEQSLWHFDLYRLEDEDEIYEIGWEDALANKILLIEWPDRLGTHLPLKRYDIFIDHGDTQEQRQISVKAVDS